VWLFSKICDMLGMVHQWWYLASSSHLWKGWAWLKMDQGWIPWAKGCISQNKRRFRS
jgi:hypothetical protein